MIHPIFAALARFHRNLLGRRLPRGRGPRPSRRGSERVWLVWRARTARGVRYGYSLWPENGRSSANDNSGVFQR